jgi:hypothetical protein
VNCAPLIRDIYAAFSNRRYPGDNEIVHCEYDARWGGKLPGPCRECSEVVDYFKGKSNRRLAARKLRGISFALFTLAPQAFLFWLPSFLAAAVRDPREADVVLGSLEFRFRPPRDSVEARWQKTRLPLLSESQIDVVNRCFQHLCERELMDTRTLSSIVDVLNKEVAKRPSNKWMERTLKTRRSS